MKLYKKEIYCVELEREELLFLFGLIEQMDLSKDSSLETISMYHKFKKFLQSETSKEESSPPLRQELGICEGCETDIEVNSTKDPITGKETPLCFACQAHRNGIAKLLEITNEKSKNSTNSRADS